MDDLERYRRRQAAAWKRLRGWGVRNVRCICGEEDPVCFDAEHVERKKGSDFAWGTCKNCHAKKSVREAMESPALPPVMSNPIEKAAHALLGIIFYLEETTARLRLVVDLLLKLVALGISVEE